MELLVFKRLDYNSQISKNGLELINDVEKF